MTTHEEAIEAAYKAFCDRDWGGNLDWIEDVIPKYLELRGELRWGPRELGTRSLVLKSSPDRIYRTPVYIVPQPGKEVVPSEPQPEEGEKPDEAGASDADDYIDQLNVLCEDFGCEAGSDRLQWLQCRLSLVEDQARRIEELEGAMADALIWAVKRARRGKSEA